MKRIVSFQIDEKLLAKLDEVAKRSNGTRSEMLRCLIEKALENQALIQEILPVKEVVI